MSAGSVWIDRLTPPTGALLHDEAIPVASLAAERLLLPSVGPSAVAVTRLADQMLVARADSGFSIDSDLLAAMIGVYSGRLCHTLVRATRFGLLDWWPASPGSASGALRVPAFVVPTDGVLRKASPPMRELFALIGVTVPDVVTTNA